MKAERKDYDRVTDVLAPLAQLHKVPADKLENARRRGSAVDEAIEFHMAGIPHNTLPDEWKPYLESAKLWLEDKKIWKQKERLYEDQYALTGEFDCIRQTTDGLVIIDFKATYGEGATWPLQGAAYAFLADQSFRSESFIGIEFVHLDKLGRAPKVYKYDKFENLDTFFDCLTIYRKFWKNKRPEDLDYL